MAASCILMGRVWVTRLVYHYILCFSFLSVFLCLEVSGKGSLFSCVGDYCTKKTTPVTKTADHDEDTNRQYIICS